MSDSYASLEKLYTWSKVQKNEKDLSRIMGVMQIILQILLHNFLKLIHHHFQLSNLDYIYIYIYLK